MKPFRIPAICAIAVLLASCVHYTPPVEQSFIPDENTVILYGRFQFEDNVTRGNPNNWGYQMALNIIGAREADRALRATPPVVSRQSKSQA